MSYQYGTPLTLKPGGDAEFNPGGGTAWLDGTAWMSAALDLGAAPAVDQIVAATVETGALAPDVGEAYHFYAIFGPNATTFDHPLITGVDGRFAAGVEQEQINGLKHRAGQLILPNSANTVIPQDLGVLDPWGRYVVVVAWNRSGRDGADSVNFEVRITPRALA